MQGKYKSKKCSKGLKIKKANEGLQLIEDGALTQGATNLGTGLSGLGALAIEGATKSKYDPKYTSQLDDSSQAVGRGIGAAAGQGLNLLVPGLGTVASPLLSSAGGAIQRSLQGDKLKKIKANEEFKDATNKMNEKVGVDLTSFQAKQYQGGTKKVQPYKAKTKEEFDSRSKAYNDSLSLYNKFPQTPTRKMTSWESSFHKNKKIKPIGIVEGKWSNWEKKNGGEERKKEDVPVYAKPKQPILPPDEVQTFEAKKDTVLDSSKGQFVQEVKSSDSRLANDKGYSKYKVRAKVEPANKKAKGVKVIEIEGKKTPEIHTDANFNIKNLGTTPHSKGGNKVVAEEGDVVFPTQNSPKKYNEIMNAIMKKDKYKLKKEQSKLPEDKVKYATGGTISGETPAEKLARLRTKAGKTDGRAKSAEEVRNLQSGIWGSIENWVAETDSKNQAYKKNLKTSEKDYQGLTVGEVEELKQLEGLEKKGGLPNSKVSPARPNYSPTVINPLAKPMLTNAAGYLTNQGGLTPQVPTPTKNAKGKSTGSKKKGTSKKWTNPNTPMNKLDSQFTVSDNTPVIPEKIATKDISLTPANADGSYGKGYTKGLPKVDLNSAMELAPIAYNLGQGLFGKTEKVNRREFNPQMEQYVDTSAPTRRAINEGYKTNVANSRNLSGGLASNMRANSQAAANAKVGHINQVDSQEYGKQLDVNNRNIGRTNEAKLTNLGLQNQYDELDAMNRAKKGEALSQGLTELGQLGARNTLQKNNLQATKINAKAIEAGRSYGKGFTTEGNQISDYDFGFDENRAAGIPTTNLLGSLDITKKKRAAKQSKGNKSIQVERKYKLK